MKGRIDNDAAFFMSYVQGEDRAGGRFFTRGLKKVSGEAALSVLAYNLIRAIDLIGATTLCARLV
jgi:hypothetical protein